MLGKSINFKKLEKMQKKKCKCIIQRKIQARKIYNCLKIGGRKEIKKYDIKIGGWKGEKCQENEKEKQGKMQEVKV